MGQYIELAIPILLESYHMGVFNSALSMYCIVSVTNDRCAVVQWRIKCPSCYHGSRTDYGYS